MRLGVMPCAPSAWCHAVTDGLAGVQMAVHEQLLLWAQRRMQWMDYELSGANVQHAHTVRPDTLPSATRSTQGRWHVLPIVSLPRPAGEAPLFPFLSH